MFLTIH